MNDSFSTPLNQLMNQPPSYAEILHNEQSNAPSGTSGSITGPRDIQAPLGPDLRQPPQMPSQKHQELQAPVFEQNFMDFPVQEQITSNKIPVVDSNNTPDEKTNGGLFDDIFNQNTQYDILYIIAAGVFMHSDVVQRMIRTYWPSLYNGTQMTMTGILLQCALLGMMFVLIRHLSSIKK